MNRSGLLAAVIGLLALSHAPLHAQTIETQTGWAMWANSVKLNDRWGLISDVQVRSSDDWKDVRNLIIRPGISYFLDAQNTLSAGYAFIRTYSPTAPDITEHRTWQQLVSNKKFRGNPLTHRLRLEQRFIERVTGENVYSDRLRYFVRLQVPLGKKAGQPFTRGKYLAVQNEVFLNVSGRRNLNGQLLDQNRAYLGFGQRLSAKADIEIGYLNQQVNGRSRDTQNHVIQLAVFTRL